MKDKKLVWFSHTSLEGLERCPRCFWLQYKKGIRQPEGIVSRLANRFDAVLKNYFNIYRPLGELPPLIEGKIKGKLQNPFVEKYFVRFNDDYGFYGKLDECLVTHDGEFVPIDFKTASSDPRNKETLAAYQSQIDDYVYLLQKKGYKTTGEGYLIYFFPDLGTKLHDGFPMINHIVKIKADPHSTVKRIENAIKVLESSMPDANPDCVFCSYRENVLKAEKEGRQN